MNSLMSMKNFEEWGKHYQQEQHNTESTAFTEAFSTSRDSLVAKGSIAKPMRRRSRRKSPTTLLNANPNNFRSLVQKFTGCRRSNSCNSASLAYKKGPINLNFANYNNRCTSDKPDIMQHQQQLDHSKLQEYTIVQEKSDPRFFSIGTNGVTDSAAATMVDSSSFVSSEVNNYIPNQFNLDEFDMVLQEMSRAENYPDVPRNNDQFWGY